MKLSNLNIIILFTFLLIWSCKPKCPVYSCKIRMHHRHGLIMKPKTLKEWGQEINKKLNGDTLQTDSTQTEGGIEEASTENIGISSDSLTTADDSSLSKEERKAKKNQEKEERKRKKKEEKEAKRKEKEEVKEAKRKEKNEQRIAEGKPPKKKKEKGGEESVGEASEETLEEEVDPEFTAEDGEGEKKSEEEKAAEKVWRSRMTPWWVGQKRKPKVGQRWKKPKDKEKKKRSKK